ncbi:hypothetical protein LR48_Vigan04g096300 [Vigna angularis]|uniref:Uncharacterized protein n=1 Tax=Phaseolus angularis TaxID=3914 RepID=A0A0L9UCW1_PHAAN|nr:hypothetical protein LR48_Vigan04g096300 [Vigna angularis]
MFPRPFGHEPFGQAFKRSFGPLQQILTQPFNSYMLLLMAVMTTSTDGCVYNIY